MPKFPGRFGVPPRPRHSLLGRRPRVGHCPEGPLGHRLGTVDGLERQHGVLKIGREDQQLEQLRHPRRRQPLLGGYGGLVCDEPPGRWRPGGGARGPASGRPSPAAVRGIGLRGRRLLGEERARACGRPSRGGTHRFGLGGGGSVRSTREHLAMGEKPACRARDGDAQEAGGLSVAIHRGLIGDRASRRGSSGAHLGEGGHDPQGPWRPPSSMACRTNDHVTYGFT